MTARVVDLDGLAEDERVYYWRLCRLLDLGYVMPDAEELAASEADLHALETLVLLRGCTLELAAEIFR